MIKTDRAAMPPSGLSVPITVTSWPGDSCSLEAGAGILKAVSPRVIVTVRGPSLVLTVMLPSSILVMVPTSARARPIWKSPLSW